MNQFLGPPWRSEPWQPSQQGVVVATGCQSLEGLPFSSRAKKMIPCFLSAIIELVLGVVAFIISHHEREEATSTSLRETAHYSEILILELVMTWIIFLWEGDQMHF